MRSCQNCATPIPTAATECEHCGAMQLTTVGGEAIREFPELGAVEKGNTEIDLQVKRYSLLSLIGGAIIISAISGISVGSFVLGVSTFFIALLALFILYQIAGIDVSL